MIPDRAAHTVAIRPGRPEMKIQHFFDESTGTLSYVLHDATTGVVIDPLRDYDSRSDRAFPGRVACRRMSTSEDQ